MTIIPCCVHGSKISQPKYCVKLLRNTGREPLWVSSQQCTARGFELEGLVHLRLRSLRRRWGQQPQVFILAEYKMHCWLLMWPSLPLRHFALHRPDICRPRLMSTCLAPDGTPLRVQLTSKGHSGRYFYTAAKTVAVYFLDSHSK